MFKQNAEFGEFKADLSDFFGNDCCGGTREEEKMSPRTCKVVFIDEIRLDTSLSGLTFTRAHLGEEKSPIASLFFKGIMVANGPGTAKVTQD